VSEQQSASAGEPVVVKKYANRRLYDTSSSAYVTLDDLAEMVKSGTDFVVYDAKTNEDLTRQILTQIIVEQEGRGENLLPIQFLRQLIRMYGAPGQGPSPLPSYLEMSLDAFVRQQERLREAFSGGLGRTTAGGGPLNEQVRQNMQMFERAMQMFSPLAYAQGAGTAAPAQLPEEEHRVVVGILDEQHAQGSGRGSPGAGLTQVRPSSPKGHGPPGPCLPA